ncbi:hypothetical protein [Chryseobacterium echinoideorum]|uniref:hypothetical protein n=1 Tax=Chryseobacterium echinoideorum TaxID=1549648 RepID=UPI001184F036|nr:hypothetical protein [Chryseobacterium echinoideorum]
MLDLLKNSLNVKVLGEEQMLSVAGGGTCGVVYHETSGGSKFTCLMDSQMTMAEAKEAMNAFNNAETTTGNEYATWCCDSCSNYVPCN